MSGLPVDPSELVAVLNAYDGQLRTEAEVATATWVDRDGPLFRACFGHGSGFVTYRDLTSEMVDRSLEILDEIFRKEFA